MELENQPSLIPLQEPSGDQWNYSYFGGGCYQVFTRKESKVPVLAVFQDPKMGTAPRMTVAENLLIAKFRGEKRGLFRDACPAIRMSFRLPLKR